MEQVSRRKKILVIEDEPDIVDLISSVLCDEGYEVLTASNGEEGLKVIEKVKPHLILLDMNMPKMGGIAFYHQIFDKEKERPSYPVLILTGRSDLEKVFSELNVDGFISKPFDIDQLLKEVSIIISKRYTGGVSQAAALGDRQRRVLIVESTQNVSDQIAVAFLNKDFAVCSAGTALKAVERAMAEHPDIILIRTNLPDMPGDLLACKLKQMPKTMDIPILLYTGNTEPSERQVTQEICRKAGLPDMLESTVPEELLRESLRLLG